MYLCRSMNLSSRKQTCLRKVVWAGRDMSLSTSASLSLSVCLLCDSVSPLCISLSFCLHVCISLHFSYCFSAFVSLWLSVCFCFSYVWLCFPARLYFSISAFLCLFVITCLSLVRKRLLWYYGHMLEVDVTTASCSRDSIRYRATGEPQFSRRNSASEARRGGRTKKGRERKEEGGGRKEEPPLVPHCEK